MSARVSGWFLLTEATVGSMACGDLVKFQVEVNEDNTINKAVFKAFGCGSVIASSAYATELLQGKNLEDAYNISNKGWVFLELLQFFTQLIVIPCLTLFVHFFYIFYFFSYFLDISDHLKLPPVKLHCSLLAEEAIKKALDNFKAKNAE